MNFNMWELLTLGDGGGASGTLTIVFGVTNAICLDQ